MIWKKKLISITLFHFEYIKHVSWNPFFREILNESTTNSKTKQKCGDGDEKDEILIQ